MQLFAIWHQIVCLMSSLRNYILFLQLPPERVTWTRRESPSGPFDGFFGPGLRLVRSCIANWSGMTTVESKSIYRRRWRPPKANDATCCIGDRSRYVSIFNRNIIFQYCTSPGLSGCIVSHRAAKQRETDGEQVGKGKRKRVGRVGENAIRKEFAS